VSVRYLLSDNPIYQVRAHLIIASTSLVTM